MSDDGFRQSLLARITRYRGVEESVEAKMDELAKERDRARERRVAAEALYQAEFGQLQQTESGQSHSRLTVPRREKGPLTGAPWDAAIESVLREAGQPLHVNEIWDRLQDAGFATAATDPKRSVAAIAVRNPRMARAGRNTYTLITRTEEASRSD